jgi:hypothetical protein
MQVLKRSRSRAALAAIIGDWQRDLALAVNDQVCEAPNSASVIRPQPDRFAPGENGVPGSRRIRISSRPRARTARSDERLGRRERPTLSWALPCDPRHRVSRRRTQAAVDDLVALDKIVGRSSEAISAVLPVRRLGAPAAHA